MTVPVIFQWDGDNMAPLKRFKSLCDKQYVVGQTYPLIVEEIRSRASHDHYFAALHNAWLNLPETIAERYATETHLRKWCLIRAGYHDEKSFVCSSKAEAIRLAAFIKPIDDYAVVVVSEAVVKVFTALSQSKRAMGAKVFQESKDRVLGVVANMVGVTPAALKAEAGEAA